LKGKVFPPYGWIVNMIIQVYDAEKNMLGLLLPLENVYEQRGDGKRREGADHDGDDEGS